MFAKNLNIIAPFIYVVILLSVVSCNKNDLPVSVTDTDNSLLRSNSSMILGRIFTEEVYPTYFIQGAAITLKGDTSKFQTVTNDSGKYVINYIPNGNFLITVASVGYDTVKKDITLTGVDTIRIDFNLHIKYNFEPGIVLMGIVDSASFRSVFNFDDTIGFPLPQMTGFEHTTNLISLDSANQIYNLLFEKPYLNKYGSQPKVIEIGDSARVTVYNFFDMSREEFLDWFSVRDSLGIFYVNNPNKYIQIKVPTGDEKYWLNQFKKSKLTRWLTLNYYVQGTFF